VSKCRSSPTQSPSVSVGLKPVNLSDAFAPQTNVCNPPAAQQTLTSTTCSTALVVPRYALTTSIAITARVRTLTFVPTPQASLRTHSHAFVVNLSANLISSAFYLILQQQQQPLLILKSILLF